MKPRVPIRALFFLVIVTTTTTLATEPLLQYDFTTKSCVEDESFENQGSLGSPITLIRNASTTTCSNVGLGVETDISYSTLARTVGSSRIEASIPMASLLQELQQQQQPRPVPPAGITMSLWIQPYSIEDDEETASNLASLPIPILTIGRKNPSNSNSGLTECDRRNIDFELLVHGADLELYYHTSDPFFEPCQRVRLGDKIHPNQLYHLAIVLGNGQQQIFINSQPSPIYRQPFEGSLSHWDPESLLQLFPSRHNTLPWQGRIYHFSLIPQLWGETQVRAVMAEGLPAPAPYTTATRISMMEDAGLTRSFSLTTGNNNHTAWHDDPLTFPAMDLPVGFLKYEEDALLSSLSIRHDPPTPAYSYITRLPATGHLYQLDGTPLVGGEEGTAIPLGEPRVIFVPLPNDHSLFPGAEYTSFEYCVSRHAIFAASQCESTANISIVVEAVNDPPVAIVQEDFYMVHEGIIEEPRGLHLSGSDVDSEDAIARVQITSVPKWGYLYLSVTAFRDDGLFHGTLLSNINNTISGSEAFVEYRFQSADRVLQGGSVTDSFRFRVQDRAGLWSDEVTAHIQVLPALSIVSGEMAQGVEGENVTITLVGEDRSGLYRTVGVFFDTIPEPREGKLVAFTTRVIDKADVLHLSDMEVNISFVPSPELCATENEVNITFSYRIIALNEDDESITSSSGVAEKLVHVTCNVAEIDLHVPTEPYEVKMFDLFMNDTCSGYLFNASETDPETCSSSVAIFSDDIKISSKKELVEEVYVSLSSTFGFLTINRDQRQHIRSIDDQAEMRQSIRFCTQAHLLNDVLSFLHFQSREPGGDDIEIEIRYGRNCSKNETVVAVSTDECFILTRSIQVEVLAPDPADTEYLKTNFPYLPFPFMITMICLLKFKGKLREKNILKTEEDEFIDEPTENADSSSSGDLDLAAKPVLWIQYYDDETGFYYYKNIADGTVTWDVPPEDEDFIPAQEDEPAQVDEAAESSENDNDSDDVPWIQYYDDDGGFYYYKNRHDGTVTWDVPLDDNFIPAEED